MEELISLNAFKFNIQDSLPVRFLHEGAGDAFQLRADAEDICQGRSLRTDDAPAIRIQRGELAVGLISLARFCRRETIGVATRAQTLRQATIGVPRRGGHVLKNKKICTW